MLPDSRVRRGPCPFCEKLFVGLGNHLRRCPKRGDADYKQFLAAATQSRSTKGKKRPCPCCGRRFKRLDTHRRVSAVCKETVTPTVEQRLLPPPRQPALTNCLCAEPIDRSTTTQGVGLTEPQGSRQVNDFRTTEVAQPSRRLLSLKLPETADMWI